jgi:hypothetical protein
MFSILSLARESMGIESIHQSDIPVPVIINVSSDKMLVPNFDEAGIPSGNIAITDRQKLLTLLQIINATNQHKFILCDVFLYKRFVSAFDLPLAEAIMATKRIVFPSFNSVEELILDTIPDKVGISYYQSTFVSKNFFKYKYLYKDTLQSVALKMFESIDNSTIERKGFLFISNKKICQNSLAIDYPFQVKEKYYEQLNNQLYELGTDNLE